MDEGKELLYKIIDNKLIKLSEIDENDYLFNNVNLVELSSSIMNDINYFANVTDDIIDKVLSSTNYQDLRKTLIKIRDLYLGKKDYSIKVEDKEEYHAAISTFVNLLNQMLENNHPDITKASYIKKECENIILKLKRKELIEDTILIERMVGDYDPVRYGKNLLTVMDFITKHNLTVLNTKDVVKETIDTKYVRRVKIDERIKEMLEKLKIAYEDIPNFIIGELKSCNVDEVLETFKLVKKTKAENYGILHFIKKDNILAKISLILYSTPESVKNVVDSLRNEDNTIDMEVLKILINNTLPCFFVKKNEYYQIKHNDYMSNIKLLKELKVNYKMLIKKCPIYVISNYEVLKYTFDYITKLDGDLKLLINRCYKTLAIDPSLIIENIDILRKYNIDLKDYLKNSKDKYNLLKVRNLNIKLKYIINHYNLDINRIDTELISKIIVNKVYQECKSAKIIWSE